METPGELNVPARDRGEIGRER